MTSIAQAIRAALLTGDPRVREAAREAIARYGTSRSASPLAGGYTDLHEGFEREVAAFLGYEAAVLFASGYQANVGTISALVGPGDLVLTDLFDHASIIDGARLSGAEVRFFQHNSVEHLRRLLAREAKGRATLVLHVGKPIVVREFREEYEADPFEAVYELTDKIRQRLSSLILDTADDDEDLLLRRLEILHQNEHQPSPAGHHFWAQAMLDELRALAKNDPDTFAELRQKVAHYFHLLAEHGLWDIGVRLRRRRKRDLAYVLAGAPLWLFGKINNFIPARLPGWVNARFNDDPAYDSTYKYLTGLVAFPLFYGLQTWLVHWLFHYPMATILYLASLWPSAVYMWHWEKRFGMLKHAHRFRQLWKRDHDTAVTLLELRQELLDLIEEMGLG